MIFFTADSHYGHEALAFNRGFNSVEEHDQTMIQNWNHVVGKGDVVYHLGDFALPQIQSRVEAILRELNGVKHLIRGNHERKQTERAKGWASVADYREKKIEGVLVCMFHYSIRNWHHNEKGSLHVYGHSHGELPGRGRSMDVGVDTNNWTPWSWEEVVNWA